MLFDFLTPSVPIDRFKDGQLIVSTVQAPDADRPETAVAHPDYNGGKWVIVEHYNTVEDAEKGHTQWVKCMTADILPNELVDVSECGVAQLGAALSGDKWTTRFPRKVEEKDDI